MSFPRILVRSFLTLSLTSLAAAQWNPPAAQWGKVDAADLRVMTWNVQDMLCSTNAKVEGNNNWCACARIVAALKPDVLVLEECGDNSGNGTGSGVDSVAELTLTIDDFLHGGTDSFNGNTPITSWVQKYAGTYDLPYAYVSTSSDGFNRNVLLSRYPFVDLNGDTKSAISDIPNVTATGYAPGGTGGIRGFIFAEIDLPNATYGGNLVMGGAHLKSGGTTSDHNQRIAAAQNVAYVMRNWFNGNGGSVPDPAGRIADVPMATSVLNTLTPIVIGGDWNEDELLNGAVRGPADWLTQAQAPGGTSDGTDRDGSDMQLDGATQYFTGSDASHDSGNKYDYLGWQDSIAVLRIQSIFISGSNPTAAQPPECVGFAGGVSAVSSAASDHRAVFADLRLPIVDCNGNGIADSTDISSGISLDTNLNGIPDECECSAQNYCVTSPNTVGLGAVIDSAGSVSVTTNNHTLLVSGCPPSTFGLFYFGTTEIQTVFGNGFRCVGGTTFRLGVIQADILGSTQWTLNLTAPPAVGQIDAGETWRFQYWYRNAAAGGAGFNLSDARRIRFCP